MSEETYISYFWANGTEMSESVDDIEILPIGNWTLIHDLFQPVLEDIAPHAVQYIDTQTDWGYSYSGEDAQYATQLTVIWSKSDGAMNYYSTDIRYVDTEEPVFHEDIIRAGYTLTPDFTPYLAFGAILGVIIVSLTVYQRRRGRE